jgi:hypothetical protein
MPASTKAEPAAPLTQGIQVMSAVKAEDLVIARLLAWASAWSSKSAERYFEFYGDAFKPLTTSRETWRAQRTRRLATRDPIAVTLTNIEATAAGEGQIETRFQQRYESGALVDQGEKVMLWRRVGSEWFIVSESGR